MLLGMSVIYISSAALTARIIYEVNFVKINEIIFKSSKFDYDEEIRILQISDFHSKKLFKNKTYENILIKTAPHMIVITGDIIDKSDKSFKGAYRLLRILLNYTDKVYFVRGNHECKNKDRKKFIKSISKMGVHVLKNEGKYLKLGGKNIILYGADDARSFKDNLNKTLKIYDETMFSILISHSPQILDRYTKKKIDITLLGDTHGGQIRLPLIGAVKTSQGFFPKLQKGVYFINSTKKFCKKHKLKKNEYVLDNNCKDCRAVYIDCGVGVHSIPIRFLNNSQVSLIKIRK